MLPVILLAFANDKQNTGAGYLRGLTQERNAIRDALMKAEENGLCQVLVEPDATIDRIFDIFQNATYRDRIAIFHYGGHAESYSLLLESASGGKATAHSEGLVAFLAKQKSLKLIFLNGCSSQKQAEDLITAGLPAVIGTSQSINDAVATGLSTRFYKGLAAGMTIERAWTDSVDQTRTENKTTDTSALYTGSILGAPGKQNFPWELYTGEGGSVSKAWNLPEAANQPLFGLELPKSYYRKLPQSPYPGLRSFRREEAAIFFGRGTDIRKLYTQLGYEQPLILFSGNRGVGKSSLLAAGLIPRLEEMYAVASCTTDQKSIVESFSDALDRTSAENGLEKPMPDDKSHLEAKIAELQKSITAISGVAKDILEQELNRLTQLVRTKKLTFHEQWMSIEAKTGKPLVMILDELPHDSVEWKVLFEIISSIFENKPAPRGKLVLSMDTQHHGPFRNMLQTAGFPYAEIFLQPLTWNGLHEAINSITLSPVTRDYYRLQIESDSANNLSVALTGDLCDGDTTLVAPYLQVILSSLWNTATQENAQNPLFTLRGYQHGILSGEIMDRFFTQQLMLLKEWKEPPVQSGLALDLLYLHTSAHGKSSILEAARRIQTYSDRQEIIRALVNKCEELFLLTSAPSGATSLGHNLLAQTVIRNYSISLHPGQQAARILNARTVESSEPERASWLNEADLEAVENGMQGMRSLSKEENELLDLSRTKKIQAQKDRKRNRVIRSVLVSVVAIFAALAGWQWYVAEQRFQYARAGELAFTANEIVEEDNTIALNVAREAYASLGKDSPPLVLQTLSDIFHGQDERALYTSNFPHRERVFSAVFSPDGQYVLTASEDGYAKLWDLRGKELLSLPHQIEVTSAAFSPNGNQILTITRTHIHLWEKNGKLTDKDSIPETVTNLDDFSTDGMKIIPTPVDTDPTTDSLSSNQLNAVFSNDRKQMLTVSQDGASSLIKVWSSTGDSLYSFRCRGTEVNAVFSPDGRSILTASNDYTAKLWDFSNPILHRFPRQTQAMNTIDYFPETNTYVTASFDSTARIYDGTGRMIDQLVHGDVVISAWYSPDGKHILTASRDSTARIWNPKESKVTILRHDHEVTSATFSHDGKLVLTSSLDSMVRVWDIDGKTLHTYAHNGDVITAAFSSDDRHIASVSSDNVMTLWNAAGDSMHMFRHPERIYSVAFSRDGNTLLTTCADSIVRRWSAIGELLGKMVHHEKPKIAFYTSDGQHIITGGGKLVKIWDADGILQDSLAHADNVSSISLSPDGQEILTTCIDHHAFLWHFNGDLLAQYTKHTAKINFGCFIQRGTHVLTTSDDGYVIRWRTPRAIFEGLNTSPIYQLSQKERETFGIK